MMMGRDGERGAKRRQYDDRDDDADTKKQEKSARTRNPVLLHYGLAMEEKSCHEKLLDASLDYNFRKQIANVMFGKFT